MSWVTVIWAMIASASLTLAALHVLVWNQNRRAWASLAFSVAAVGAGGTAVAELLQMRAATPGEFTEAVRWGSVPVAFTVWGLIWFVWVALGKGRAWLAWLAVGLRLLALLLNFAPGPMVMYRTVTSLRHIEFLGEPLSAAGEAVTSPWAFVPALGNLALLLFVADATRSLWQVGGAEERRRALRLGGSILFFILVGAGGAALINQQVVHAPYLVSGPFLAIVLVMAYELSRNLLRASQLADELRESEYRLNLAVAAADLGLWYWNLQTGALWVTDRARELLGFSAGSLSFDMWMDRVVPDDRPSVDAAIAGMIAGKGGFDSSHRVRLPDGEVRWVSARGEVSRGAGGKPSFTTGIVMDITERKRAATETQAMRRDLAHLGRVTLLGQLSSALAHELSQPLGAILRNAEAAELLLQEPSPDLEELRAIVIDIRNDDTRAGEVISRLRSLLMRKSVELTRVNLSDVIAEVLSLAQADALARSVRLEASVAPGLPEVLGDRVHLQQVLLNLIVNGMDAVDESPVPSRCVTVDAVGSPGDGVQVSVRDNGPGIPESARARLFDPFFTTKAAGLGAGLAISKTIIEAHRGRIWAEAPTAEGGAVFRFTVPAAGPEDGRESEKSSGVEKEVPAHGD